MAENTVEGTGTITEKASETKAATLPKTIEQIQAITHVPTTEATASFARFVNKYLVNADNFDGITEEQGWAVIGIHRVWQQSEERAAEKLALKEAAAAEAAKKAEEREQKAAENKAKKEAAAAAKAKKDAEKAAKEAAEGDSDDDLDSVDDVTEDETVEGEGEIAPKKSRSRRPRPGVSAAGV